MINCWLTCTADAVLSFAGILGEVEDWVSPLVSNAPLQSAFLKYIQPSHTLEKLKALTTFVSSGTEL